MGCAVNASCECGLDRQIYIGQGFEDHETICWFPGACQRCRDVVKFNLLAGGHCSQCGTADVTAYDHDSLVARKGRRVVASWNMEESLGRELVLTNGTYLCARCNAASLRFSEGGILWD